jgi:hypothetical protein
VDGGALMGMANAVIMNHDLRHGFGWEMQAFLGFKPSPLFRFLVGQHWRADI